MLKYVLKKYTRVKWFLSHFLYHARYSTNNHAITLNRNQIKLNRILLQKLFQPIAFEMALLWMKLVDRLLLKIQQTSDYLQVNTNVFWHIFRCWIVKKKERCCSKRFKKVPIHQHCFSLASKTFNFIVSSFFDPEILKGVSSNSSGNMKVAPIFF